MPDRFYGFFGVFVPCERAAVREQMAAPGFFGNARGAALVAAVVFVFFLTLFGMAFYQLGETDIPLVEQNEDLTQTLYAAESGLERVGWLIKKRDAVQSHLAVDMNPFGPGYDPTAALSTANPNSGDFYPNGPESPYFRIVDMQGQGSKVRVRVLGAIDVDGDGEAGLPSDPDTDGFRVDAEDVSRRIEAEIGLPGSLGDDISAGAVQGFADPSGALSFEPATIAFYGESIDVLEDNAANPGLALSPPIQTGSDVSLPLGLFGESGTVNTDYFADCDKDEFTASQSFDGAVYAGKEIALVAGDVVVSGNWNGQDVTLISTTRITGLDDLDCGFDGRLILIAPEIDLNGTASTRINGIVVAGNDIQLIGDGTRPVTSSDNSAVFIGTLVAGGSIFLQQPGWIVTFDPGVANGTMFTMPTLTYDDMEDADTLTMYVTSGSTTVQMLNYSSDEIDAGAGDSQDLGVFPNPDDGWPDKYKVIWDWPGDAVRIDLVNGVFHDSDIEDIRDVDGYHDWTRWDRISFWMKLGNWYHSQTTRQATILFTLRDASGVEKKTVLDYEHMVAAPVNTYYPVDVAQWNRMTVYFSDLQGPAEFDRSKVRDMSFSYLDIDMDLGSHGRIGWIEADSSMKYYHPVYDYWYNVYVDVYDHVVHIRGMTPYEISWYNEQNDSTPRSYMHEYAVAARMAIDRIELLGSFSQDHGLPSCFHYDIYGWKEMS